jgi:translation initiation factor 2 alpha subunit (eIF-2alpha)
MTTDMDDDEIISQVVAKLVEEKDYPLDLVEPIVREEFAALAGRPVRDYLSVLTEKAAKKRLKKAKAKA